MNGQLFTHDFLAVGIRDTAVWQGLSDGDLDAFVSALTRVYRPYTLDSRINEATTEQEIIEKVLGLLGWADLTLPQVTASGGRREDVPDLLLFPDAVSKARGLKERREDRRYRHGIVIAESKRWMRVLDRGDSTDRLDPGTPSNQILRYLSSAEVASERKIRWGILTNGAVWRLYFQGARSRSEEFLEIDVATLLGVPGAPAELLQNADEKHAFKVFLCMFRRAAFLPDNDGITFHDVALAETRRYEEHVSQDLGDRVFTQVFPDLANGIVSGDSLATMPLSRAYLDEIRDATLLLLYRLLFVLYAEDRNLLPVRDPRYERYSLRRLREEIRDESDRGAVFSSSSSRLWGNVRNVFTAIAKGDSALGLPAYNGGLFEDDRLQVLTRTQIPDSVLARALDALSRRSDDARRPWINYRDLSVQHLGSIYERLLEYRLEPTGEQLAARPTSFTRRSTGSFYTHDDLVKLIIEEAIGPLIAERLAAFKARVDTLNRKREPKSRDFDGLDALDPAKAMLDLRICDPAMGSGHFLVTLVDVLADRALEAIAWAADTVVSRPWGKAKDPPWGSPLVARINTIRERILSAGKSHGWAIAIDQLDDRHIVRRMILKRVIHGVDKNPMAVELAKVALWLHTFTVGAPLSVLDHHLKCGDALHGERLESVRADLIGMGVLFQEAELDRLKDASATMGEIAELTDIDVAEAHHSRDLLEAIERNLYPLQRLQDFWRAMRWGFAGWPDVRRITNDGVAELLSGRYNLVSLFATGSLQEQSGNRSVNSANALIQDALTLARHEHFLHWPTAFPRVWSDPDPARRGFDAVIGNPPWDRMKLQEIEWFAERQPAIAHATRAADRKRMIATLQRDADPLWAEYEIAKAAAETAARVVRESGDYPLLSGGDINLYSLFVERATTLIHRRGIIGLLVPSGIAADKGAAKFFTGISGRGRINVLFDFENKRVFFPDVHASFKFCAFVFGGEDRSFQLSRCAFYLHTVSELKLPDRILDLRADDFLVVNPNTGSAPIFRNRRDAEITIAIYRRHPVLVDRRAEQQVGNLVKVWPVRYVTMFHMTNDSGLFHRQAELEQSGWYRIEGNRWKKGEQEMLPLYEGKMVQLYDHRAASVTLNIANLHRPAQPEATTVTHHEDPQYSITPQFWVSKVSIEEDSLGGWAVAFKDVTASTNVRTMIGAIVPMAGFGNTLPVLVPDINDRSDYSYWGPLLLANIASLPFDFLARQKVQGQHLNWYIVEQLPMIRPEQFDATLGRQRIGDFIRNEVVKLSFTAWDLQAFATDVGYHGPPTAWQELDRRHRMARLDALFFYLYGIGRDDAGYMLESFPIVQENDQREFGRFFTKDLVLAYLNAVAAGDLETSVVV
jgi:hypothetical protein